MCYICSENKGADQLRGYREADLSLCFRICKKAGFLTTRLICSSSLGTVIGSKINSLHKGSHDVNLVWCLSIQSESLKFPTFLVAMLLKISLNHSYAVLLVIALKCMLYEARCLILVLFKHLVCCNIRGHCSTS